jgi:hypothetical protein
VYFLTNNIIVKEQHGTVFFGIPIHSYLRDYNRISRL